MSGLVIAPVRCESFCQFVKRKMVAPSGVRRTMSASSCALHAVLASPLILVTSCLLGLLTPALGLQNNELRRTFVEEAPKGTVVADIKVDAQLDTQYPQDVLNKLNFTKVGEGSHHELFSVEKFTGKIRTETRVDRDAICPRASSCESEVRVGIRSPSGLDIMYVFITILDINDNAPTFKEAHMIKRISESTAPGILFPILEAVDNDHPENSTKRYELDAQFTQFQLVVNNDTETSGTVDLNLFLMEELDREDRDLYQLKVIAYDGGNPPKTGQVVIDLIIEDTNDNSPKFENQTYSLSFPEGLPAGSLLVKLTANDPDIGDNGLVTYRLSDLAKRRYGTVFDLDAETGKLMSLQELDYEVESQYTLGVLAEDNGLGGVAGVATVIITVLDANDNAPQITIESTDGSDDVTVMENSLPGAFVALLSVSDPDSGDGGQVECEINNSDFRLVHLIENDYKLVTSISMDREELEFQRIGVSCHDFGDPMLSSSRNLSVRIGDANDHTPVFEKLIYNCTISENNAWHAHIVTVKAHDLDSGDDGRVVYELGEDARDYFHVDPDSGEVLAQVSFDREDVSHYEFHVLAVDSGEVMRMSQCLVSLTILDEDDNPPLFEQAAYVFSISENLPPRSSVGQVKATDRDLAPNNEFGYYIDLHNNAAYDFGVDRLTGVIYTKRMLNREKVSAYSVDVIAQGSVTPVTDKCTVSIYVTDRNDNAPIIDFPTSGNNTVTMSLDKPEGSVVATVRAHDIDLGTNAVLYFMISEGNEGGEFIIEEQTGRVILNMSPMSLRKTAYELVIMVRDSGSPAQIAVSTLKVILQESSLNPMVGPTMPPYSTKNPAAAGRQTNADSLEGSGLSQTHLTIIVCVIAGCFIIALILIIAIIIVRRRPKRTDSQAPMTGDTLWAEGQSGIEGPQNKSPTEEAMSRDDSRMTEISQISDIILSLDTEPMNYQSRVEQLEKHSPKSDLDGDSGCADLSNSGSQTSNEDSDGSKRSSKASDAEGGSDIQVPLPPMTATRPQVLPQLVPAVPPMPLLQRRYSDKMHDPNNPDYGSLQRQRDRYPYEEDSPLRRTYSTPPKTQGRVPQGALAAARNLNSSFNKSSTTLPRTLSNCSKKSVRFSDMDRPETPSAKKHVHFADHDDIMSSSPERHKSPPPQYVSEGALSDSSSFTEDPKVGMPLSSYPQDGTYTTFVPVKNTSLSSLV